MCTFFFFNDTATTEIYTLSLHDALPISAVRAGSHTCNHTTKALARPCGMARGICRGSGWVPGAVAPGGCERGTGADRKSTRLNSSHANISYAVFCLKKKNTHNSMKY